MIAGEPNYPASLVAFAFHRHQPVIALMARSKINATNGHDLGLDCSDVAEEASISGGTLGVSSAEFCADAVGS